jgi:hypothetical protein
MPGHGRRDRQWSQAAVSACKLSAREITSHALEVSRLFEVTLNKLYGCARLRNTPAFPDPAGHLNAPWHRSRKTGRRSMRGAMVMPQSRIARVRARCFIGVPFHDFAAKEIFSGIFQAKRGLQQRVDRRIAQ